MNLAKVHVTTGNVNYLFAFSSKQDKEIIMSEQKLNTAGRTLDHAAGIYDVVMEAVMFGRGRRLRAQMIGLMDFKPTDRMLDLGCGTGSLTLQIAEMLRDGGQIIGIDAAVKMIEVANKKCRKRNVEDRCSFQAEIAEKLPFENESFDYCLNSMFYHHLPRELKIASLSENMRVLKPGGSFLTIDIDKPDNFFAWLFVMAGYVCFVQPAIKENIDGLLPSLISEAGFEDLKLVKKRWGMVSVYHCIKPLA